MKIDERYDPREPGGGGGYFDLLPVRALFIQDINNSAMNTINWLQKMWRDDRQHVHNSSRLFSS